MYLREQREKIWFQLVNIMLVKKLPEYSEIPPFLMQRQIKPMQEIMQQIIHAIQKEQTLVNIFVQRKVRTNRQEL